MTEETGLLLRATQDGEKKSGEQWMIRGPKKYCIPVSAEIIEERKAIILDKNQGVYVRDLEKGEVRIVSDSTYMLKAHEIIVEKTLEPEIELLIDP